MRSGAAVFACASAVVLAGIPGIPGVTGIPGAPAWAEEAGTGDAVAEAPAVAKAALLEGAESPAAVFEGMKAAVANEDYAAIVRMYSPELRQAMAAMFASHVSAVVDLVPADDDRRATHAAYKALKTKYELPDVPADAFRGQVMAEAHSDRIVEAVGDGASFLTDFLPVYQKLEIKLPPMPLLRMEDDQRDGWVDGAGTAWVVVADPHGGEQRNQWRFVRIDGRWYLGIDATVHELLATLFGDRFAE